MRKLFTLTLALLALFSTGLWAASAQPDTTILFGTGSGSPTYSNYINKTYTISTGITVTLNHYVASGAAGSAWGGTNGNYGYISFGSSANTFDQHNFRIIASGTTIDSVAFLITSNGSNAANPAIAAWEGDFAAGDAEFITALGTTNTAQSYSGSAWQKVDLSSIDAVIVGITRKLTTSMKLNGTALSAQVGNSQNFRFFGIKIWLHPAAETAPAITAPTTDQSATYTVGDAITALSVTASGNPAPTYQWYKNNSASTTGATSLGSSAQTASYTPDNSVASDLYYYCVATNSVSSATSPYFHVTVNAPSAPSHNITYNAESLKGQSVSGYPTEFYEGIGIASFDALPDVTNFHFNGWSPASIGTDVTTDVELTATWVAAYNVTFNAGDGSGTIPASFQKWEGATFNLPAQGDMTAPSGKAFDGWKAGGVKYAAGAEYTMTAAAVEFVAQWKGVPTTIFDWTKGSGAQITADETNLNGNDMGTLTTGTSVVARKLGTNNIDNNKEGYKLGNNDVCVEIQGTSAFAEGDTVIITGYNGGSGERCFAVAPSSTTDAATDTVLTSTISSQTSNSIYRVVIKSAQAGTKMRVFRKAGSTMYIKGIKVIRPAAREVVSTVITLSDVKVNDHSISSDSLAALVSAGSLELKDSYLEAPVIKFNEHTVITYDEGEPTIKDKVYTVTATENAGAWRAQQVINEVTYTVTAAKTTSYTVTYYDGNIELGSELVAASGNPADYGDYEEIYGSLASFERWENNAHETITPASIEIDKDTAFYAVYTKTYAKNVDFVGFIKASGTSGDYGTYLSSNGYLLASTTGVSLDDANAFDTGLKMKTTENNTLKFIIPAEKRVTITVGKINGMTISVNSAAAENIPSGTSAEALGSLYKESHADQYIVMTETSTAYNIILSIIITDYGVVPTALDNTTSELKAVKVLENGMLIIEKNGVRYNVTGQVIK